MIETPVVTVRKRKASLQPVKMEDIKIEFVDLCVAVPSPEEGFPIFELDGSGVTTTTTTTVLSSPPLTPMEVTFGSEMGDSVAGGGSDCVKAPRKRRKLDHLSPEEKSQHRKMMNRMSAQSARDRQKALMQQQDVKIKHMQQAAETIKKQNLVLNSKNETLSNENVALKQENTRLSQLVRELEAKLAAAAAPPPQMQFENLSGIVKQEVEQNVDDVVNVVFEAVANEDDTSSGKCSSDSSPSKPAVFRTIPLQKGTEESPQLSHNLCQNQQQQPKLNNNNPAVILLLLMSYLGIWTHLKSCKSLENSLSKFSTEINNSSEKNLSKLITLLHKWLQTHNLNSSNQSPPPILDILKMEQTSHSRSPTPG